MRHCLGIKRLWDCVRMVKEEDSYFFIRPLSDIHRAVCTV